MPHQVIDKMRLAAIHIVCHTESMLHREKTPGDTRLGTVNNLNTARSCMPHQVHLTTARSCAPHQVTCADEVGLSPGRSSC
jgi:hypothetical protein